MKQLEVGDVIYQVGRGGPFSKVAIKRVTAKRAFTEGLEFVREYSDGRIKRIGEGHYPANKYYIGTPELAQEYLNRIISTKVRVFDYSKLPIEKIKAIYEIISSK